jgi:hypothetical protein
MHVGMLLAFDGAVGAGLGAGFEHTLYQRLMAAGATRGEAGRRQADIGAIEIEADALGEILDHVLGEAGVDADVTYGGAAVGRLDRTDQAVVEAAAHVGMGANDRLDLHRGLLRVIEGQPEARDDGSER